MPASLIKEIRLEVPRIELDCPKCQEPNEIPGDNLPGYEFNCKHCDKPIRISYNVKLTLK